VVEPGQQRQIRVNARFLPSTPESEYRTLLFTEDLNEQTVQRGNTTVLVKTQIGVAVYARNGNLAPQISTENAEFDIASQNIRLAINNQGQASAFVKIEWQLRNANEVILEGETGEYSILAQMRRNVAIEEIEGLPAGEYSFSGTLNWVYDNTAQSAPFSTQISISAQS
jgi:P pilus assembly chaperone PapD